MCRVIVKRVLMRGDGLGDGAVKMLMAKLTDDLNFGIIWVLSLAKRVTLGK